MFTLSQFIKNAAVITEENTTANSTSKAKPKRKPRAKSKPSAKPSGVSEADQSTTVTSEDTPERESEVVATKKAPAKKKPAKKPKTAELVVSSEKAPQQSELSANTDQ